VSTAASIAAVDEMIAAYAAEAQRNGPLPPLAGLLARLREPLHDADIWARVGDALIRNGFAESATIVLAAALVHYPKAAELLYLRGNALRVVQRISEAESHLRSALARNPGHRQAALSLAFMLREQGRIEAAADMLLTHWRAARGAPEQTLELLEFLRGCGAYRQAYGLAVEAAAQWPQQARIAAGAGELALTFGAFDEAREYLRRALRCDPTQGPAWLRLSYCQRCTDADAPDLALLRAAWHDSRIPKMARICAGFGLGKLLDDLDDWAGAASVLRQANALARSQSPWNADAWVAAIERLAGEAAPPALEPRTGMVPVFIVGLPRTGTTLVATRLARHHEVRDRGELNWIGAMYDHLAAQNALADRTALQSVADLIATQMRRDDAPARFYVDKNPLNFRHLHLILALFPDARIVHCRRGARDTALSIWSQHFAHPDLAFSYDFSTIATAAAGHRRLMARWHALFPAAILDVDYEALVSDPAAQLERIAAFVGLPTATGTEVAAASDVITTASVWQARQPVHTQAIGRWRRYVEFIPELASLFAETDGAARL